MPPISVTSDQAGFTLLELIIGLTVGSLLLTAVYASFVGVGQTQRRVEHVIERTTTWRFVIETLRGDLAQVVNQVTFSGSAQALSTQVAGRQSGLMQTLIYQLSDQQLIRIIGSKKTVIDLPEGSRRPYFSYNTEGEWHETANIIPQGISITLDSLDGRKHHIYRLEFNPTGGVSIQGAGV